MKYIPKDFDKSKIIKGFEYSNQYYKKEYLDGSYENYYSMDQNEVQKIRNEMVLQAQKRQECMNVKDYRIKAFSFLEAAILSFELLTRCHSDNDNSFAFLLTIVGALSFTTFIEYLKIASELKKYQRFLEMYDDIKIVKNMNHDIYTPELDIENLDEFDNFFIENIYNEYKKIKKLN